MAQRESDSANMSRCDASMFIAAHRSKLGSARRGGRAACQRVLVRSRVATMAPTTISPFAKICTNAETSSRFSTFEITPSSSTAASGAGDAAAAAGERGAAEHHGDDGVELEALAGVRVAGAQPARDEQAAQARRRCPTA